MKNRIIKTIITLLTSALLLGCNTLEVNKTESDVTAQTIRNDIDLWKHRNISQYEQGRV